MRFLVFHNTSKKDAEDSLAAVNAVYGCPVILKKGYRMDSWDVVIPSKDGEKWGFYRPEARLGKRRGQLMRVIKGGFTVRQRKPDEFIPDLEGEG